MPELSGRAVLVTGGNSGIGLGIAEALLRAGADVAVWGTNPDKNAAAEQHLKAVAAERPGAGRAVLALRCDVGDEEQVVESFGQTVAALGKVDACFANAGVSHWAPFVELSLADWRAVMRVNLDGAFLTLREAARHMVERGEGGSLVAVSSVSAIHGAPNMEPYASSKAALLSLVRALAVELARHRVRANSLLPGWTDTDLTAPLKQSQRFSDAILHRTPVRRWLQPAEMGPIAVFLANPSLTAHTGDMVVVDGGYTVF